MDPPLSPQKTERSSSLTYVDEVKTFYAYAIQPRIVDLRIFSFLAAISILVRTFMISNPNQIVFDEVHFGGFAGKYINSTFFFDVHPPLGKLIIAFSGVFFGYDGSFAFEKIGIPYPETVPYVALRLVPCLFGALVPPVLLIN